MLRTPRVRHAGLRFALARVSVSLIALAGLSVTERLTASGPTSVDVSRYVRVGRFDLPETTRTSPAPLNSLLAQEASGIT